MPTYEYKCEKCQHTMEEFQSIKDKPLKKCPKCGKNGLKRLFGAGAALIFKGSGFYCTDYRKSGSTGEKPSTPKSEPSTSTGDAGSSSGNNGGASKDSGSATKPSDNAKKKD